MAANKNVRPEQKPTWEEWFTERCLRKTAEEVAKHERHEASDLTIVRDFLHIKAVCRAVFETAWRDEYNAL